MKELQKDVKVLAMEEYKRAAEKFGAKNNSPHESYAVILEEWQEALHEMSVVNGLVEEYWCLVKRNTQNGQNVVLKQMKETAINAACELIQVAAMAYKAQK